MLLPTCLGFTLWPEFFSFFPWGVWGCAGSWGGREEGFKMAIRSPWLPLTVSPGVIGLFHRPLSKL